MPNTRIVGVSVAERAKEPDRFPNRRSELWWALRDALHPDDGWLTLPDDDRLRADLTQATYRIDSKGRTVVEGKDEMRKRLGRSPDYADAVMLALSPHVYGSRRAVLRELYPEGYMARSGPRIPTMMRLRDMRG